MQWRCARGYGAVVAALLGLLLSLPARPESATRPGLPSSGETARCIRDRACHRLFVVAHRGEGFGGFENSRAAVSSAVEAGVPLIEIDLRETRDGGVFVVHDSKLSHTTDGRGKIEQVSTADIERVRLKNGESVPRFEELYAISRGHAVLSIDFKVPAEVMEKTADWIAAHGSFDDVIFFANTGEEIMAAARAKQRYPQMIVMVRLLDTRVTVESTRAAFGGHLPEILHTDRVGAREVAELHAQGVKVYMNALPLERYYQPFKYLAMRSLLSTGLDFVLTGEAATVMRKVAGGRT